MKITPILKNTELRIKKGQDVTLLVLFYMMAIILGYLKDLCFLNERNMPVLNNFVCYVISSDNYCMSY